MTLPILQDDALTSTREGFALKVCLPWIRSLPLSSVTELRLVIDGRTCDSLRATIDDRSIAIDAMATESGVVVSAGPPHPARRVDARAGHPHRDRLLRARRALLAEWTGRSAHDSVLRRTIVGCSRRADGGAHLAPGGTRSRRSGGDPHAVDALGERLQLDGGRDSRRPSRDRHRGRHCRRRRGFRHRTRGRPALALIS